MGRPSDYDEDVAERICSDLSHGIPLAEICRSLGIGRTTVYDWKAAHPSFSERIARAREAGFDALADECLAIADETAHDTKFVGEDDTPVPNAEWISRSKLRVETRLKLLAKWDPKRYGDRVAHELSGPDGGAIVVRAEELGDDDLARIASGGGS